MLENTIQDNLYQFVTEVEGLAVDLELKIRFIDAIRDVKRKLEHSLEEIELRKIMVELDELVIQIRKTVEPEQKNLVVNDLTIVSESDVKKRIGKMLDECNKTNKIIAQERLQGYKTYIDETERAMRDIAKTEVNYERILDSEYFLQSFQTIGTRHNKKIEEIAVDYLEEASMNYDTTVERIGNMLSNISDQRLKLRRKELYVQWTERFPSVKQQLKNDIEAADKGGELIKNFGKKCQEPLLKMIHKTKKKYRRRKRMPFYLLLILLLIACVLTISIIVAVSDLGGNLMKETEEFVTEIQDTQMVETEQGGTIQKVTDKLNEINSGIEEGEKLWGNLKKIADNIGLSAILPMLNMLFVPILAIGGTIWYVLCKHMNKKCKAQICKETGKYLTEQLDVFWMEQHIQLKVEEKYNEIVNRVAFTYEHILEEIFGMVVYDEREDKDSNIGKMLQICNEWENVKRGNL